METIYWGEESMERRETQKDSPGIGKSKISKTNDSSNSNPKSEISNPSGDTSADKIPSIGSQDPSAPLGFEISDFGFELLESFVFEIRFLKKYNGAMLRLFRHAQRVGA
jgi:hypothetical protein